MNFLKKIIDFLKKLGVIQGVTVSTYKSSKDKGYKPPDPLKGF
jgi:hypothetical protein